MEKVKVTRRIPTDGRLPKEIYEEARQSIGSFYDQKTGMPALAFAPKSADEAMVMEYLTGVHPEEKTFRQAVKDYCINFSLEVPAKGKTLDISKNEAGFPNSPKDYFAFHYIKKHPDVYDQDNAELGKIRPPAETVFFLIDPNIEKQRKKELNALKEKAMATYLKVKKNKTAVNYILELTKSQHKKVVTSIPEEDRTDVLSEVYEANPQLFYEVANDQHLEEKAILSRLLEANVLQEHGNAIYEENEKLADSRESMVFWLSDTKNKEKVSKLKDRLAREVKTK